MLLFVLACGLSVTLGVMNFINLAHGSFARRICNMSPPAVPHVTGQDDVVDFILVAPHQPIIVRVARLVAHQVPIDAELFGQRAALQPVAQHHGRVAFMAVAGPQRRERRFHAVGRANRQPRPRTTSGDRREWTIASQRPRRASARAAKGARPPVRCATAWRTDLARRGRTSESGQCHRDP